MSGRMQPEGHLPNLIIIGAMKCATTALHTYLNLHPDIQMSREKELNFFVKEKNWPKGEAWYRSNFKGDAKIRGESSPAYANWPHYSGVARRMAALIPDAKLIYCLRDPIERIISNYAYRQADGLAPPNLSDAITTLDIQNRYFMRSCYFTQLEQYISHFPKDRIFITTTEELSAHRRQTLKAVFRFLGVDDSFYCEKFNTPIHTAIGRRRKTALGLVLKRCFEASIARLMPLPARIRVGQFLSIPFSRPVVKPDLDEHNRERLAAALAPDLERLRGFCGRRFRNWSI